jgi:hypothetical protein
MNNHIAVAGLGNVKRLQSDALRLFKNDCLCLHDLWPAP